MAKTFKLLEQLQTSNWDSTSNQKKPPTQSIQYQEYELEVQSKGTAVLIPIRECDAFESEIESMDKISTDELRQLLRKYRGIRG